MPSVGNAVPPHSKIATWQAVCSYLRCRYSLLYRLRFGVHKPLPPKLDRAHRKTISRPPRIRRRPILLQQSQLRILASSQVRISLRPTPIA